MTIRCEIVSQDHVVYSGEADIVLLPGAAGAMGILPNHSPLLTALQPGIITVRLNQSDNYFTVSGGVAEVQPDQVTILADAAEDVEKINLQRAEEAKKRIEAILAKGVPPDSDQYLTLKAALHRSNLRINAFNRFHREKRQY